MTSEVAMRNLSWDLVNNFETPVDYRYDVTDPINEQFENPSIEALTWRLEFDMEEMLKE